MGNSKSRKIDIKLYKIYKIHKNRTFTSVFKMKVFGRGTHALMNSKTETEEALSHFIQKHNCENPLQLFDLQKTLVTLSILMISLESVAAFLA